MSDDACDPNVYKYGSSLGLFDMTREEADQFCKEQTEKTGLLHDWNRFAGRVSVKSLDPEYLKVALLREAAPELLSALEKYHNNMGHILDLLLEMGSRESIILCNDLSINSPIAFEAIKKAKGE